MINALNLSANDPAPVRTGTPLQTTLQTTLQAPLQTPLQAPLQAPPRQAPVYAPPQNAPVAAPRDRQPPLPPPTGPPTVGAAGRREVLVPCGECIAHGRGESDSDDGHDHGPIGDPTGRYVNCCRHTCPLCRGPPPDHVGPWPPHDHDSDEDDEFEYCAQVGRRSTTTEGYHVPLHSINILDTGSDHVVRPMYQADSLDREIRLRGIAGIVAVGYMQNDGEIAMPGQIDFILPLMPLCTACGWNMVMYEDDPSRPRLRNLRMGETIQVFASEYDVPIVEDEDRNRLRESLRNHRGYMRAQDLGLARRDPIVHPVEQGFDAAILQQMITHDDSQSDDGGADDGDSTVH